MSCEEYNRIHWEKFLNLGGLDLCLYDEHEWSWSGLGDPVLHIELRKWADVVVVAPASADIMAKAANGIADNLLLCVLRAWDTSKPSVMCPAMNTLMLRHPSMDTHMGTLRAFGWRFIESAVKALACGEAGNGALASVDTIVSTTRGIAGEMSLQAVYSPERIE
ncbi:HAL3B, partial [Symbiodinium microadriaticum]